MLSNIAHFIHESLLLLIPYPYTAVPASLSLLVTTGLFSISMGLLLFCYITSLLYFLDSTHKQYHRLFVFLCLTCLFLKDNVMINLFLNLTRPWYLAKHQSWWRYILKKINIPTNKTLIKADTLHNVGWPYEIGGSLQRSRLRLPNRGNILPLDGFRTRAVTPALPQVSSCCLLCRFRLTSPLHHLNQFLKSLLKKKLYPQTHTHILLVLFL